MKHNNLWNVSPLVFLFTIVWDLGSFVVCHSSLQAIYWQYFRDSIKALKHMMESFQWHTAHTMFMTTAAAIWFSHGTSAHSLVLYGFHGR